MAYKVERAEAVDRDFEAIFDFLFASYCQFGDLPDEAFERAEQRLHSIENDLFALGNVPHQGTLLPTLLPGLRSVTKNRAIFYFEVDDDNRCLRVLAVFFGAQDHQRAMLKRLLTARG